MDVIFAFAVLSGKWFSFYSKSIIYLCHYILLFAILSLLDLLRYRYFYVYLYDVNLDRLKYEWQDLPYRYTEL